MPQTKTQGCGLRTADVVFHGAGDGGRQRRAQARRDVKRGLSARAEGDRVHGRDRLCRLHALWQPRGQHIAHRFVQLGRDNPLLVTLAVSGCTVMVMCPSMCLIATALFTGIDAEFFRALSRHALPQPAVGAAVADLCCRRPRAACSARSFTSSSWKTTAKPFLPTRNVIRWTPEKSRCFSCMTN